MSKIDKSDAEGKQTTVEEGTQFKGTLSSTCQVMVRGVVDGDLTAPTVIISETGTVTGNVKAECIRSEGVLAGRVDADDVYLSGSVRSDTVIRAKTLEVKLKSQRDKLEITFGECILDVGDDPSAEVADSARTQNTTAIARRSAAPQVQTDTEEGNSSSNRRSAPPPPS